MRSLALAVLVVTVPALARAEGTASAPVARTERSFLSALGVSLLVLGAGAAGVGVAGTVSATEAWSVLDRYVRPPTKEEAAEVGVLDDRLGAGVGIAVGGLLGAAALISLGIGLLVVDTPATPVRVSVTPTRDGAYATLSLRW